MPAVPDFDRRAAAYDRHARVQKTAARWLAEWLPTGITGPSVEFGAGSGFFTKHISSLGRDLLATDASPRMVEAGRANFPGVRWSVADASSPPAVEEACRWIFSSSLVQWLPEPAAAFRRWHDISAPGARLLAGWFIRGTMAGLLEVCPAIAPFRWRSRPEWESALDDAGWRIERSETKTFDLVHPSSAHMLREVHDIGAVVPHRLGAGRLRSALRAHDAAHGHGQSVVTPFVFLRLEAVRS